MAQKNEVLDWFHANGRNQSKTARHIDKKWPDLEIKQPKVSDWVKKEQSIWDLHSDNPVVAKTLHRVRLVKHSEADEAVSMWVSQALENGVTVTGEVIQEKWQHFAASLNIPGSEWLHLSEGWLSQFKERNGLHERKKHGEAGSQNVATADAE